MHRASHRVCQVSDQAYAHVVMLDRACAQYASELRLIDTRVVLPDELPRRSEGVAR